MSTISGVAKRYNGDAIDYVLFFDWISGKCLGKSVPNLTGNWSFDYYKNLNCGITYVADGCDPVTHGSYQFIGVWQPQALLDDNKMSLWYDPSDLSSMFQDVAGTIPVTADGQAVGLIKDKSGKNHHASQSNQAQKPLYRTDGNLHWLEFDGIDDFFSTVPWEQPYDKSFHACVGIKRLSSGIPLEMFKGVLIYSGNDGATGNGWLAGYYDKYALHHFPSYADGDTSVISIQTELGYSKLSVNKYDFFQPIYQDFFSNSVISLSIGARANPGASYFCKCNIYSVIFSESADVDYAIHYTAEQSGVEIL